jgi:hypothetical protein
MNRHERRKALVMERRKVNLDDISPGMTCLWDGCSARYDDDMPTGWCYLLTYSNKRPITIINFHKPLPRGSVWGYDAALCPKHHAELQRLMKIALPDPLLTSMGNA